MKSTTHHAFLHRRALIIAGMSVLLGGATAVAQTNTGTDSTSPTTSSTDSAKSGTTATGQTDPSAGYGASSTTGTTTSGTTDRSTTGGATTMTGRATTTDKLGWMDRRFVTKTADSGTSEVELAELAVEHAANPDVKSYAQMLVEAHSKVNAELLSLAQAKNVKIDTEDLGSDRAHRRLSKKADIEFDREFVEHMIDSHEEGVKRFTKASTDAKDADVRAFAAKHLEALREHLAKAESLRTTIMPTGRTDDANRTPATTDTTTPATTPSTTEPTAVPPPRSDSDTTPRPDNQP